MDMVRSCYRTQMRLRQDSNELTWVRWFFCAPGAEFCPPTVFHSLNWGYPEKRPPTIGEVYGSPRPWVNGSAPGPYKFRGECESDRWIRHGLPADAVSPIPPIVDGVPICCRLVAGGVTLRGTGRYVRALGGLWSRGGSAVNYRDFPDRGLRSTGSGQVGIGGLSSWGTGLVSLGGLESFSEP